MYLAVNKKIFSAAEYRSSMAGTKTPGISLFSSRGMDLLLHIFRALILEHHNVKACFRCPGTQIRIYRDEPGRSIASSIRDIVSAECYCLSNQIASAAIVVAGPSRA